MMMITMRMRSRCGRRKSTMMRSRWWRREEEEEYGVNVHLYHYDCIFTGTYWNNNSPVIYL